MKRAGFLLGVLLVILLCPLGMGGRASQTQVTPNSINVGLYPYVPRPQQFKQVIEAAWSKVQPDVKINWVGTWDGGYSSDPDNTLDVFAFDAVYYDYFKQKGYLFALNKNQVQSIDDFVPYAINGVLLGDTLYGIPQLGCGEFLFYAKSDVAIAAATTLSQLVTALGSCTYFNITPPATKGLMADFSGGTTDATNYVISLHEKTNQFPVPLPYTPGQIDPDTARTIQKIVGLASFSNVLYKNDASPYQRGIWYGQGNGRAYVGFMESLSQIDPSKLGAIAFKPMPWTDTPDGWKHPLFYADVIAVNAGTVSRGTTQLAIQLANLMASTDVVTECFMASGNQGPQYLIALRKSVYDKLGALYPLYKDISAMLQNTQPTMFNLGPDAKNWLSTIKSAMQSMVLANPMCYCDAQAGPIYNNNDAQQKCPGVCSFHGGWNGQWTTNGPGSSVCGCNCGVH